MLRVEGEPSWILLVLILVRALSTCDNIKTIADLKDWKLYKVVIKVNIVSILFLWSVTFTNNVFAMGQARAACNDRYDDPIL